MDMVGENYVILQGLIERPNLKKVGQNNTSLFNGTLNIPTQTEGRSQYIKIAAWGTTAEALAEVPRKVHIRMQGHIEERSYDGKCRHCGGFDKKYWTNVVVGTFIIVEGE